MATIINLEEQRKTLNESLFRLFQSTRLNFLLGSGASMPAIQVLDNIERSVQKKINAGNNSDAQEELYDFLVNINAATNTLVNKLICAKTEETQNNFNRLFKLIERILNERHSSILSKKINVFTTNYDLFIEDALEAFDSFYLIDGFNRKPSLHGRATFSSNVYSNSIYNSGNLYNYKVELPSVNLYKLHGSMSWAKDGTDIIYKIPDRAALPEDSSAANKEAFNNEHALILPRKHKFEETLLQQVYYDLLRLYANQLDKENTTLIAFGFSFADEHILDITQRALSNPALKLIIFAFEDWDSSEFDCIFNQYSNVDIIQSSTKIDFSVFNKIIEESLNKADSNDA